jgi:hypothetical protein
MAGNLRLRDGRLGENGARQAAAGVADNALIWRPSPKIYPGLSGRP